MVSLICSSLISLHFLKIILSFLRNTISVTKELERASGAEGWVDVCKGWDE